MDRIFVLEQSRSELIKTLNCEELAIFNYGLILHKMFHLFCSRSIDYIKTKIGLIKLQTEFARPDDRTSEPQALLALEKSLLK